MPFYCVIPGDRWLQVGNARCDADVWRAERRRHGRCQLGEALKEIDESCAMPSVSAWCLLSQVALSCAGDSSGKAYEGD